jgi:hypothetical protein
VSRSSCAFTLWGKTPPPFLVVLIDVHSSLLSDIFIVASAHAEQKRSKSGPSKKLIGTGKTQINGQEQRPDL